MQVNVAKRLWRGLAQDIVANLIAGSPIVPARFRYVILRVAGFDAARTAIQSGVRWFGSGPVTIGAGGFMNRYCVINHSGSVTIGDGVFFGPEVMILTATHVIGDSARRGGKGYSSPVTIGNGVWLGARVTVMPGVVIGDGAVVGAGSLVIHDIEPNTLNVGVPARQVREMA